MSDGTVQIHGKTYHTVAGRIDTFRKDYGLEYSIETEILMAADLVQVKAVIRNIENGAVVASGLAEEVRGSTNINKTSAVENCETSAVGRALAFFGLGGTEIASADEVANAINQQQELEAAEELMSYNALLRDNFDSIYFIRQGIAEGDYSLASEAWFELDDETKRGLWKAPSKGGIFTTKERDIMKSKEFKEANGGFDNE